eukprot:537086-Pelagomonas_calceolata.AAC.1
MLVARRGVRTGGEYSNLPFPFIPRSARVGSAQQASTFIPRSARVHSFIPRSARVFHTAHKEPLFVQP